MIQYSKIKFRPHILLFNEGKKQADLMLRSYIPDNKKREYILLELVALDPTTPKNKYLETITRTYLFVLQDSLSRSVKKEAIPNYVLKNYMEWFIRDGLGEKIKSVEERKLTIDLTQIKTPMDFKKIIDETFNKVTKSMAKKGISGLTKDKDYIEIPLKNNQYESKVYIPLNHKASRVIASVRVAGCEAKWCTASNMDDHWVSYIQQNEGILVYVINYAEGLNDFMRKEAIYFYPKDREWIEAFDLNDKRMKPTDVIGFSEIKPFVLNNWQKIREIIFKDSFPQEGFFPIRNMRNITGIITDICTVLEDGKIFKNTATRDYMFVTKQKYESDDCTFKLDMRGWEKYFKVHPSNPEIYKCSKPILDITRRIKKIYIKHELNPDNIETNPEFDKRYSDLINDYKLLIEWE